MRLKKVEIQGFKSFADKTEIQFKDGITAIVGPNGSGKSNISDAIRWVLGEQSVKTLRGSKMEDIIFAGTSKRKALGYAEVTITFDNKSGSIPIEYEEVAVTRRMFRSGESEYYLNKNSCRLKDIRELFMDTGVGKDGYSIIGQGRIEEILSNRPEDRRSIFEEAAGIVKYKSKKEEAAKKLEKTEENLIRIKDLVFELSSQLKVLEDQSQKANYFSKLFNRLKDLEVNIFLKDIKKINLQIEEINKEKIILEKELALRIIEREQIEEQFNLIKTNTESLDLEIEDSREESTKISNELDKNKNQIAILQEKEGFYNRDLKRISDEKDNLEKKLEELKETNIITSQKIEEDIINQEKLLSDYNSKSLELNQGLEVLQEKESYIDSEKNNMIKIYNSSSDTRSELNSIISFNENIEKRTFQLNKEINGMMVEKDLSRDKYKELDSYEDGLKQDLHIMKEAISNMKSKSVENEEIQDSINKTINRNNMEMQSKLSSLKLFKSMEEGYEGYYKGVKSFLKAAKRDPKIQEGLVGVVAELIKVEERFERAIDIALGSNAQNLVTETEQSAKKIIEYLKHNKLGRVTCLPLNIIKGNVLNLNPKDRENFKIIGLGSEIIDFHEDHENIFAYLLGRTVIVEDIDNGIRLANKYKHSYRIVTLQGEVLNPGGSMTGGSYASNSISIINRKNRIEELEKDIGEFSEVQKGLEEKKIESLDKIKRIKDEISELEEKIKNKEYEIINIANNKEKQNNEFLRLEEAIKKSQDEIINLNIEVNNYLIKKEELNESLSKLENESLSLKEKIKELTIAFNEDKSNREKLTTELTDIQIMINTNDNKIKNLQDRLDKDTIEISNINILLKEKEKNIILNEKNIEEVLKSKTVSEKTIEELDVLEINTNKKLKELIKQKEMFMEDFYTRQKTLMEINKTIGDMEKLNNSQEVKLAKISVQLENYHRKLDEDYELDFEEASKHEVEIPDIQAAIVESRKLKVEIKELGAVNLSSIEEYKTLKTRMDFISEQKEDLTNAKENLREVIKDMEIKMKDQFILSFKEINENFQSIFKILFDGGKAELILEDEEDILNSGIEIKAQPPGKKLQNLTLLSGGEKSLTAVALLFSILKIKPAPFCILDEIDAALDEANIGRYTNYLKTFCQDTQFVMITHRKTTMEMADVLYGVAMEEDGISRLISVKLKDNMNEIAS